MVSIKRPFHNLQICSIAMSLMFFPLCYSQRQQALTTKAIPHLLLPPINQWEDTLSKAALTSQWDTATPLQQLEPRLKWVATPLHLEPRPQWRVMDRPRPPANHMPGCHHPKLERRMRMRQCSSSTRQTLVLSRHRKVVWEAVVTWVDSRKNDRPIRNKCRSLNITVFNISMISMCLNFIYLSKFVLCKTSAIVELWNSKFCLASTQSREWDGLRISSHELTRLTRCFSSYHNKGFIHCEDRETLRSGF